MASEALINVIERQDFLEQASDAIQPAVSNTFKAAGPAGHEVKNFLHGTWLGHPLHPVLTDVPIGAWTAALALDAMESISGLPLNLRLIREIRCGGHRGLPQYLIHHGLTPGIGVSGRLLIRGRR